MKNDLSPSDLMGLERAFQERVQQRRWLELDDKAQAHVLRFKWIDAVWTAAGVSLLLTISACVVMALALLGYYGQEIINLGVLLLGGGA